MRWGFLLMRLGAVAVAGELVYQDYAAGKASVSGGFVAQEWRSLACAPQWDWPCWWALATIQCESSGNPAAYNFAGPYLGLFQVLNGSTDPMQNTLQAHQQFREWMAGVRQTSPWPNCPAGSAGVRP